MCVYIFQLTALVLFLFLWAEFADKLLNEFLLYN